MLGTPLFRGGMDVVVVLDNGGGLKRSDPVQLQGVRIGNVTDIRLAPAGGVLVSCASMTASPSPRYPRRRPRRRLRRAPRPARPASP
jgi:hypothetical protein